MEDSDKIWAGIISAIAGIGTLASIFINLSIAGPIIGVIAGSVITYFVQSRTQKRSWKRDFIIENIRTIYGPLYNASLKIESTLNHIENVMQYENLPTTEWIAIEGTFTYHMVDNEELRKEIQNFYVLIKTFNELAGNSWKQAHDFLEKRGSEFYGLDVRDIHYITTTDLGGSSEPVIFNCILFKKHPKDASYFKSGKVIISIEHRVGNTHPRLNLDSNEKIREFDDLWNQIIDDVNHDPQLQQLESLKLQIHTKNLEIREKLVKRINERHDL